MGVSSTLLMVFMGLVAYDAVPVGVVVIELLVVLVMTLQYIVYMTHQCAMSVSHVWRVGGVFDGRR